MIIENTHKSNGTPPVPMSEPCAQFFVEHAKFFVLHHFIMDVAMELDRVRHIARNGPYCLTRTDQTGDFS